MEENKTSNAGQGLGIAGLVLGIITLIISFIPCIGVWAILPGIVAIVLSAIGFSQATKANAAKGLVIAALIISIIGTAIASWQIYIFKSDPSKMEKKIEKARKEELDDEDMKELEEAMEELEGEIEEVSEENAEEIGRAAGKALKEFNDEVKKANKELEDDTTDE